MISPEVLDEWFDANFETGILKWAKSRNGKAMAGSIAGNLDKDGYMRTMIFGKPLKVHRILFCMYYRRWPNGQLDHIDGDKLNNSISNLREASAAENSRNKKLTVKSTSGLKGAYFDKRKNRWRASIKTDSKFKHLGHFDTPEEAHEAYCRAAKELHGDFARFK